MTEWVTIKIPKPTRDKAKADDRTYEEIMKAGLGENPEGLDVDALEQAMNQISMANEPGVELDTEEVLREVGKAVELAEQARDNTDEIKEKLK